MSKELIERLRKRHQALYGKDATPSCISEAADRIEELERERDGWKASAENRLEIQRQREEKIDALLADNARLREVLSYFNEYSVALHALTITPEQSLTALTARIRAEVMAEFADQLETLRDRLKSVIQIQENPS